ncbi:hypothetical protein ACWEGE_45155 [Amycolatopsis sp. NPDC004747]
MTWFSGTGFPGVPLRQFGPAILSGLPAFARDLDVRERSECATIEACEY